MPDEIFCGTYIKDRCVIQINTIPLYYDSDHVSNEGAFFIVEELFK